MLNKTKTTKLVPIVMNNPSLVNVLSVPGHQRDSCAMSTVLFTDTENQLIISTTRDKPVIIIAELLQSQTWVFPTISLCLSPSDHTRTTSKTKNSNVLTQHAT